MKTYIAFSTENKAYICEADSKKQMKEKGINMGLEWQEVKDFETAKIQVECNGYELKNTTRLTTA